MGASVSPLRLLIVDDFPQVRQDLAAAFKLAGGIEVVGEASDGREAVDLATRLRPDVVLLDLEMPVLDGYEAARRIKRARPSCRVVALTVHGDEAARRNAALAGIDDFVVKGAPLKTLTRALAGR
jgi:DNA-binding NarL/FixJ family response regulator